tara:strand:+ start:431 stop:883 length:453 start_codon:yes stop_codon:yes gene_type:complete
MKKDLFFMQRALKQAKDAAILGEVPVGAVLTLNDEIIAEDHNRSISLNDPSAHAEINVIRKGAELLGNYRLPNTSLYVTLEPCMMCCGALVHARIDNLIFSAADPKSGAVISNLNLLEAEFLNHAISFKQGPLIEESADLLKCFFRERRL